MLTYKLDRNSAASLYEQLYRYIKQDIVSGRLACNEKLPSKRMLADHLKLSVVTVKAAYEQLIAEGYLFAVEKKGYYVNAVDNPQRSAAAPMPVEKVTGKKYRLDLVSNSISAEYFPFALWARTMRRTLLDHEGELLRSAPFNGAEALRNAIADSLWQFRGMQVDPNNIIIGAGTELLYGLLIQLLGMDCCYAVEDPGYGKISRIYESHGVRVVHIPLDEKGLSPVELRRSGAQVVHLSPSHHYPTGTVMPIGRRQELLRWGEEAKERYILEDEYDSEFRFVGKPIPTLYSVDEHECVIYLNTFSKTIAPSIRISYMVLPDGLMKKYRRELSFYSCTVSSFEQYTLAEFMNAGSYEQHINRMRTRYRKKRDEVISLIESSSLSGRVQIMEQDAGLHFLMKLHTELSDDEIKRRAADAGIRIALLSDYCFDKTKAEEHIFVVNYSGAELSDIAWGMEKLSELCFG